MAIIDVKQSEILGSAGIKRTINAGAEKLILDTIQITQYVKPEESTVRELVSNAVDAQREKEKAISILTGKSTVEEHYIHRDDATYKDSNWDSSYYSLEHLAADQENVELIYQQNQGTGWCDRFIIRDYGVGIGPSRLEGYFSIGYSTKRNSTSQLGGFGSTGPLY
jgi:signal transduction histidine kinase